MAGDIEEISQNQFDEKACKSICVVDFFAEWCMPCIMMGPVIEEMAEKFSGKINFFKVNIDDNSELAKKFEVMSIPTLIVFRNGEIIDRRAGAIQADQLEEKLQSFLE